MELLQRKQDESVVDFIKRTYETVKVGKGKEKQWLTYVESNLGSEAGEEVIKDLIIFNNTIEFLLTDGEKTNISIMTAITKADEYMPGDITNNMYTWIYKVLVKLDVPYKTELKDFIYDKYGIEC